MSPLLEACGIRREFPGVLALDDVSVSLFAGEVLAIVGENGAGKSTLMKILAGVYQPSAGELFLDGVSIAFPDALAAVDAGISLIHQELNLAENLSVAANITLGREATRFGLLNDDRARPRILQTLEAVGLPAALVDARVGRLAPGQKQLVEIARALAMNARAIIMDEPTSSLTQSETDRLYQVIDSLKARGVAVVYISHRLAEVKRVADRAVVLRDGKNAGELAKDDITHENLVKRMVGRELKTLYPRTRIPGTSNPVLRLEEVVYRGGPGTPVSLEVFPGEVLGMAGLVGAGRTELAEAVFGIRQLGAGQIVLNGQPVVIQHPREAIDAGLAMVPEDRRAHGLVLEEGAGFNIPLPHLDRFCGIAFVNRRAADENSRNWVQQLSIKTPGLSRAVGFLSGGNQQKVVFGKWLTGEPKLLILDEPTRGVDVGARGEIYAIIDRLAAQGLAIWMISSDMEELLGMSDRIAVLHEGRLAGILPRGATEEAVLTLATGGSP